MEQYNQFLAHLSSVDQLPKNIEMHSKCQGISATTKCEKPRKEWYKPYKHKGMLIDIFHRSMLSGYEVERTTILTRLEDTVYQVCCGKVDVLIRSCDYRELWLEAQSTFEEFTKVYGLLDEASCPSMTMDYLRKNAQLPIATDDNGDEVILPYLIIPKTK